MTTQPLDMPHAEEPASDAPPGVSPSARRESPTASPVNVPNAITLLRLALAFVVLALIDRGGSWILCTVIFVIAVLTDHIDGYLARRWNQVTALGRVLDPFVDKIVIGGSLIFLTAHPMSGVTPWLTFIVIGREMFITGLRSVLESHGVDFSAKFSGKLKMLIQSVTVPCCLLSLAPQVQNGLGSLWGEFLLLRNAMLWLTVLITLYSGIEYLWRAWRLLRANPGTPRQG